MPGTKKPNRTKRRKVHSNAKISKSSPLVRRKKQASKVRHVKRQQKAATDLVEMLEMLVKIAPTAEHILRKITTPSFPLIQPFDLQNYRSNVRSWLPGKGSAAQVSSHFFEFMDVLEEQQPAAGLSSWEVARRVLGSNGQVSGAYQAVTYFGYVVVFNDLIAYPIPHSWVVLEERNQKKPKQILIDGSLPEGLAGHLLDLLSLDYDTTPDFKKEFDGYSLRNHGFVAGKCPHGLMYVGAPADPESVEATILWWTQAVVDDQKSKGVDLLPPLDYSMAGILQFIRSLSDNAVEIDDGEAIPEEPAGDLSGQSDREHGRGDDSSDPEEAAVSDEGDHRGDGV